MTEDQFPKILLKELKHDIRSLTTYNGEDLKEIRSKLTFKHKGLCIDAETGFLYIIRKDYENELHRSRNKVYLNKNLTKYITFVVDECKLYSDILTRKEGAARFERRIKVDDTTNIQEIIKNIIKENDYYFTEEITLPQARTVVEKSLKRLPDYTGKKMRYNNVLSFYYIIRLV